MHKKKNQNIYLILMVTVLLAISIHTGINANRTPQKTEVHEISVILPDSSNPRWNVFKIGLRTAARENSINLNIVKTTEFTSTTEEKELIHHEIDNGTDAVIAECINTNDTDDLISDVTAHIPLILIDNPPAITDSSNENLSVFSISNLKAGASLAMQATSNISDSASIGILAGNRNALMSTQRLTGLLANLKDSNIEPNWILYEDEVSMDNLKAAQETAHADILIALDNEALESAIDYRESNTKETAKLYGIGNSDKCIYHTDLEMVQSLIVPDEYSMGYKAVQQLVGKLNRKSDLSDVIIDYSVITKANLFTSKNQELLFPIGQ